MTGAAANANIAARLAERAVAHPRRPAVIDRKERLDFGELAGRVARAGGALRGSGVGADDGVLIFVPMSASLYVTLLGALHAGGVAVFLDAWATRARLDAAVRIAAPCAFVGSLRAHLLRLLSGAVRAVPRHFVAGARGLRGEPRAAELRSGDDPALVTFTTGSTGPPKAAMRSHGFLWAQHEALAEHLALREDDIDMPTLPVFVLNNLALGVTSVLPDFDPRRPGQVRPERVLRQIVRERVTTSSGSPAFYERLARHCELTGARLPLRALFTGGAPVQPALARRLRDVTAGTAHVVYGSTEAEPIAGITVDEMASLADAPGSEGVCVGRPVASVRLRLVRPHDDAIVLGPGGWGEWLATDGVGEVVVAGRHVLRGYMNDPEGERRNKIRDGGMVWHRTGDAARLDSDGRLWLMGRVRERVGRSGQVWWPLPAEVRARSVAGVTHAAYLGAPDDSMGQRTVLCVEADPARAADLGDALRRALGDWPVDELRVLRRIPRDPRHESKTNTEALRALLGL